MNWAILDSTVGDLLLVAEGDVLVEIGFPPAAAQIAPPSDAREGGRFLARVARQLTEYFDGSRTTFDVPLAPEGTPFQQRVWTELARIPYGTTISYGELARRVGNPNASRAVGAANGKNPIPVIVPCHRVIGSSGRLTGFGGGLDAKRTLLELEARGAVLFPD